MKKVVLTGASGFVGANLLRWLVQIGHEVHVVLRPTSAMWRLRDESVLGSVRQHVIDYANYDETSEMFREISPNWVIHMAAYGAYPYRKGKPFQQNVLEMLRTNNYGSAVLLQCAAESGAEFFINAGSSSEYGLKANPMSETDSLEPVDNYGASKAGAGLVLNTMAASLGIRMYHLRLFSVYGPYEEPARFVPTVMLGCLTDTPLQLANPRSVRDFIHIEDVISAVDHIASVLPPVGIYNLGSGRQSSTGDVVGLVQHIAGKTAAVMWGEIQSRPNEPTSWVADITKICNTGWTPRVSLEQGLEKTYEWFSRNNALYENL